MATTENIHTANGSTTNFAFTFPYLETTDVKVATKASGATSYTDSATTEYSFADATTVQFNSAPANNTSVKLYRDTDNDNLKATFYSGSAIRSTDLNNNYTQIHYVSQEVENASTTATTTANAAKTTADGADANATTALNNSRESDGSGGWTTAIAKATSATSTANSAKTATDTYVHDGSTLKGTGTGGQPQGVAYAVTTATNASNAVGDKIDKDGSVAMTAALAMGTNKITGAGDPTAAQDVATKAYVDAQNTAQELDAAKITSGTLPAARIGAHIDTTKFDASKLIIASESAAHTPNDTTMYTTGGVDNRIDSRVKTLVEEVGGFVAIANETSFPNTNPDINDNAGTLVSIKALSTNYTSSGSGVITISNGTVGNSTVTVNGAENSTTYASGFGLIVETTSTLNTYTFHRLVPKVGEVTTVSGIAANITTVAGISANVTTVANNNANVTSVAGNATNINTVAGNITHSEDLGLVSEALTTGSTSAVTTVGANMDAVLSFEDTYKVAASAPSSGVTEGDLWYDSNTNALKYYNGSTWVVSASGNISQIVEDTTPQLGGHLDLNGKNIQGDAVTIESETGTEDYITCVKDGAVTLFHDAASKLATAATGVTVTGLMSATTIDGAAGANLQLDFGTLS